MFEKFQILKNERIDIFLLITLTSIFPISLLIGSAINNFLLIFISLLFLYNCLKDKNFKFLKNYYFYLLIFFFFTLILNIFLSKYGTQDVSRQLGFVRFILFVFGVSFCLNYSNGKYKELIIKNWFVIFLIVTFDICFEFIFGFNTIGNSSNFAGRLSSFLGDELKIGNFYYGFFLISISYLLKIDQDKKYFFLFTIMFFVIVSFLIGERSNFIKVFIGFIIFLYFYEKIPTFIKLICSSLIVTTFFFILMFNESLNNRAKQIYEPIIKMGVIKYIQTSHYGAHYDTAIKIYESNKLFGIGLKQFRNESGKKIYDDNKNNIYNRDNWATHPHQIHFEILSEGGLILYISFLIVFLVTLYKSFKSYLHNNDKYLLSGIIFVFTTFIPILPSGSFFTTYTASIFWLNYALIISYDKRKKI